MTNILQACSALAITKTANQKVFFIIADDDAPRKIKGTEIESNRILIAFESHWVTSR